MKMAAHFAASFGVVLAVAAVVGCEKKPEGPDYAPLQSELALSLKPIKGWAASEMELSADQLEVHRRVGVTQIIARCYKSEFTGQEVQMRLVGGNRSGISRYRPETAGTMVGSPYDGHYFETLDSRGVAYAFSRTVQIRPDHRHVLWTHMLAGGWNRWWMNVALGVDRYSFTVWFEVVSPSNTNPKEVSSDTKALIARIMDQISPRVIAHHLATAAEFPKPKD